MRIRKQMRDPRRRLPGMPWNVWHVPADMNQAWVTAMRGPSVIDELLDILREGEVGHVEGVTFNEYAPVDADVWDAIEYPMPMLPRMEANQIDGGRSVAACTSPCEGDSEGSTPPATPSYTLAPSVYLP